MASPCADDVAELELEKVENELETKVWLNKSLTRMVRKKKASTVER